MTKKSNASDEGADKVLIQGLVRTLGVVPQNLISFLVGSIVRSPLPAPLRRPVNKAFINLFGINMAEAERPASAYKTIEDIFTRKLQSDARKIVGTFVSPADGILEKSEPVLNGMAVQAKGINYSLEELVYGRGNHVPEDFNAAWFVTVYLAPHNYHRVHAPFEGRVSKLRYIPGRLWPVNRPAVRAIPGLFCRNERLVFDFDVSKGGKAYVVMVGAMNVGRMVTPLKSDFVTNAARRQLGEIKATELSLDSVSGERGCGDEIGTFMLGSTVVVVLDAKATAALLPRKIESPEVARMGQSLSV